jgi:hypothetical protein
MAEGRVRYKGQFAKAPPAGDPSAADGKAAAGKGSKGAGEVATSVAMHVTCAARCLSCSCLLPTGASVLVQDRLHP